MIVELIMELLFYGVQSLLPSRDKSRTVGPATWRFPVESAVEKEREREGIVGRGSKQRVQSTDHDN